MSLGIYKHNKKSKWWKVQWRTDNDSRIFQIMRRNYYSHCYSTFPSSSEWMT